MWLFNVYDVIIMGNKMTLTETATLPVATLMVEDVPFLVEIDTQKHLRQQTLVYA